MSTPKVKSPMANCKFLIYTCWETPLDSGGRIGGSLLHNLCPQTEEEAKKMVANLTQSSESYYEKFLALNTTRRYVYIKNEEYWWWPKHD